MYTDYMDSISKEEKMKLEAEVKKYQIERIISIKEKALNNEITKEDFIKIFDYWFGVASINPQWNWPKNNPMWVQQCWEEFEICIGDSEHENILKLFKLQRSEFFDKLFEMYLSKGQLL